MATDLVVVLQNDPRLMSAIEHVYVMGGWRVLENGERRSSYNWSMDSSAAAALMEMVGAGAFPATLYSSHVIGPLFAGGSVRSSNAPELIHLLMESNAPGMYCSMV